MGSAYIFAIPGAPVSVKVNNSLVKRTMLACIVNKINETREGHIVTIEDPIEYLHRHHKSLASQREAPNDTATFSRALRTALR